MPDSQRSSPATEIRHVLLRQLATRLVNVLFSSAGEGDPTHLFPWVLGSYERVVWFLTLSAMLVDVALSITACNSACTSATPSHMRCSTLRMLWDCIESNSAGYSPDCVVTR